MISSQRSIALFAVSSHKKATILSEKSIYIDLVNSQPGHGMYFIQLPSLAYTLATNNVQVLNGIVHQD